jgi:hypothetical protein
MKVGEIEQRNEKETTSFGLVKFYSDQNFSGIPEQSKNNFHILT